MGRGFPGNALIVLAGNALTKIVLPQAIPAPLAHFNEMIRFGARRRIRFGARLNKTWFKPDSLFAFSSHGIAPGSPPSIDRARQRDVF